MANGRARKADPADYGKTVDKLQDHLLKSMRRNGEFLKLVLRSDNEYNKDVKLLLEESSVYLSVLIVDNVKLEFGKHGDPQFFGDSTQLGYVEQYSQLCKPGLTNVQVGHAALMNAYTKLNRFRGVGDKNFSKWCDEIRHSLATLLFMFPECTRFRWISQAAKKLVMDGRVNACVVDWMADLIPFWSKITEVFLNGGDCDHDPYAPPPPPLPVGRHEYGDREETKTSRCIASLSHSSKGSRGSVLSGSLGGLKALLQADD
ncbi:hypothetical protein CTI12_AA430700 [Artemisia annua]|uniref:rRNA N-glycosylase n=1 Tax=Artemisia annua TaxID=35608 RepID=A0A2U1M187_ARTAN|nr:hypothetical protein CTI12_AA430700 [Artemisia annua]